MPIAQNANIAEWGLAKQSAEGTPGANPEYALPLYSGLPGPSQTIEPIRVTDTTNSLAVIWKTDEHAEMDGVVAALPLSLGLMLKGILPTEVVAGVADPWTHTFTPPGTASWFTYWSRRPGDLYERYADCLVEEVAFQFEAGQPLRIGHRMVGKTPSVLGSAYTATTTEAFHQSAEFFIPQGGTFKLDEAATPAATIENNIAGGTLRIFREADPVPTADLITPNFINRGVLEVGVSLDLIWKDYEAYRATYYQAIAGSTAGPTILRGSVDFLFSSYVNATNRDVKVQLPSVALLVPTPPDADPGGSAFRVSVDGMAMRPASGDLVTVVLRNSRSTSY